MPELFPGMGVVTQILVIILAFSFLVFIHELGHYIAARLVGVRVESFYIGIPIYGMAIRREWNGTTYGVGLLPLGGFVKLAGQSDDPRGMGTTGTKDELYSKPLWAQALVFVSGVAMNLLFGFFLLIWAYMHGIPFIPAVLGELDPVGAAAIHGLREGDIVTAIDGKRIESFEDLSGAIALAGVANERVIAINRPKPEGGYEPMTVKVLARHSPEFRGNLASIGAGTPFSNQIGGMVDTADFAEVRKRLSIGDRIVSVDGQPIYDDQGRKALRLAEQIKGNTVTLGVRRSGAAADAPAETVTIPMETFGEWDTGARFALRLSEVSAGGAAEAADLKPGDSVIAVQVGSDPPVRFGRDYTQFTNIIRNSTRQSVTLSLLRDGQPATVTLTPEPLPGAIAFANPADDSWIGATLRPAAGADEDGHADAILGRSSPANGGKAIVDTVIPGGPGENRLRPGDEIVAINDLPVTMETSFQNQVMSAAMAELTLYVKRGNGAGGHGIVRAQLPFEDLSKLDTVRLRPQFDGQTRRPLIGVVTMPAEVVYLEPGSPLAQSSGAILGARLFGMLLSPDLKVTTLLVRFPDDSSAASVSGGPRGLLLATPEAIRDNPDEAGLKKRLPFMFQIARVSNPMAFFPAVKQAGVKWVDLSLTIYRTIGQLLSRDIELKAMGGPVQLFRIIKVADDRGFGYLLYVVALISINLGVCNLLPFPVLDGGHLMFLAYEAVFRRKPSDLFLGIAQYAGLICLLAVMLTVTGYDLMDLFSW